MSDYRVFTDGYADASYVVDAKEIEAINLRYTVTDRPTIRFIRTKDGGLINVDHIILIKPMAEDDRRRQL